MNMVEKKEVNEFITEFAGALTGALEKAALEWYYKATNATGFPYISINPRIPSGDDLLVGGLSIPPWVIGALMEEAAKKRGDMKAREFGYNLKEFGEGNVIYALNMLIHHTVARNTWAAPVQARAFPRMGAEQRTNIGHKVLKL